MFWSKGQKRESLLNGKLDLDIPIQPVFPEDVIIYQKELSRSRISEVIVLFTAVIQQTGPRASLFEQYPCGLHLFHRIGLQFAAEADLLNSQSGRPLNISRA